MIELTAANDDDDDGVAMPDARADGPVRWVNDPRRYKYFRHSVDDDVEP